MNSLWGMLGKPAVPRVDTDDVYPLHMLDNTKTLRSIVVTWTLRFDDVLDADKLHNALARLLDMSDWRKLGGRMRLSEKGVAEIHVPRLFTADRPPVAFSCETHTMGIEEHELAQTLPKATDELSIQRDPGDFLAFAARHDAPQTPDDFLYYDVPLLSLHVTAFTNATLVGLSWPHALMDVMGQQALLRAWSLVLAGREVDVPAVLGAREDALCAAADASGSAEELKVAKQQLKGISLMRFGLRFAWDMVSGPAAEGRTIYMPASTLMALRQEAEGDLAVAGEAPFISDGDVLTAWAARAVAVSLPQPRPVTVLHAVNARFRLPALVNAPGVFIQNMAVAGFTLLSAAEATGPLGAIAVANRRHLSEQASEGQILACVRELRRDTAGDPRVLCGPSDALLLPMTNWARADVFNSADFSAAVVRPGPTGNPGRVVYHHADAMRPSASTRNVFVVLGKDHRGGYWMSAKLPLAAWDRLASVLRIE
ncbi:hypothetical protein FPOAC2_13554 [Fusarium poae]